MQPSQGVNNTTRRNPNPLGVSEKYFRGLNGGFLNIFNIRIAGPRSHSSIRKKVCVEKRNLTAGVARLIIHMILFLAFSTPIISNQV